MVLLYTKPCDDDFIEKIKDPNPNFERAFERDSMELSEAVLMLCGYLPGPWLNWVPRDLDVLFKLENEFKFFSLARDAIRGKRLEGTLEISTYYVFLPTLAYWAFKKKIPMHPSIDYFIDQRFGSKKRGRKQDYPEIVREIAKHFQEKGVIRVTKSILKKEKSQSIQALIREYDKKSGTEQERRIKTLAGNVNKSLAPSVPY